MPQGSSSINSGCKNSDSKSPETSKKLSCKEQSSEFKAEIIPYNREDPNEPILAFSGGNINLIFSIPKESFKKLAVAAIGHLEQESDIRLQEKAFCNSCKEKSEMSIKSSNIQDINVDNSNYIATSENESCKSKGRNIDNLDAKSCKDSDLSMNKAENHHDSESSVASQFTDEAKSTNEDIETATSREVLDTTSKTSEINSDFSDNFLNQHTVQHSPTDEKFDNHSKATGSTQENSVQMPNSFNDSEVECKVDGSDGNEKEFNEIEKPEQHNLDKKQTDFTDQNIPEEMNLSAYSLDVSFGSCPELEAAWPDIHPFTETENIPIKELKSMELNGIFTKYLKLEDSREFIVLKISSESNIFVDAVKYKKADSKFEGSPEKSNVEKVSQSKEKSTNSLICNLCKKSLSVVNLNESSIHATKSVCQPSERKVGEQTTNGKDLASELSIVKNVPPEVAERNIVFQPTSEISNKDLLNLSGQILNESSMYSDFSIANKAFASKITSSPLKIELDESFEHGTLLDTFESTEFQRTLTLKIEEKLKEQNETIPGDSPIERLKFILKKDMKSFSKDESTEQYQIIPGSSIERLKFILNEDFKSCSKDESTKQTEELTNDNSEVSDGTHTEISSPKNFNESNDIQILESSLEDANSRNEKLESFSDSSCKGRDFHKMKIAHDANSKDITSSDVKTEQSRTASECASTLHAKPNEQTSSSKDCEFVSKEQESALEKSVQEDGNFAAEIPLCDDSLQVAKIQKESKDISFDNKKDSLEDSGLNESFCNFDSEVSMKKSSQLENNESEEIDSHNKFGTGLCELQTEVLEKNAKLSDNVCIKSAMRNANSQKKLLGEIIEDSCQNEITTNKKSEPLENTFEETVTEEESSPKDIIVADVDCESVKETCKEKLNIYETKTDKSMENSSEERNKLTNSEVKPSKSEKTDAVGKISEVLQSEENIESKHEICSAALENHSRNDMKKGETENISEEIIADECGEILNQTSEIVEESKPSSEESVVEKSIKRENVASEISLCDTSDSLQVKKIQKVSKEASKVPENESYVERSEECIDLVADELRLSGNSFASNLDSCMDTTVETLAESMSEGDFESDDVKSVASESDDSKEEKKISKRKDLKKQFETDEVDCAPTRVRTRKVIGSLMKDVIPENTELKNAKTSYSQSSTLDVSSKNSVKKSPVGRCLRSKSLDPSPHPDKGVDRKHASVVESEEINRRVRSKTPDIVSKKDLKVTMRSSPRKLARSSANTESNTTSKAQSAKTNVADKSRTNLESSVLSSKRNKRGSRD